MNSRTSILLAAIGLILPSLNPSAHAFGGPPGGPFSNGSYFPNDGTFSAVLRGENLTGTVQFSTTVGSGPASSTTQSQSIDLAFGASATSSTTSSGTGGVGSTGVATIYYEGDSLRGNSQGSNNPANSSMTITFQAGAPGQGQQTIDVKTPVTVLVNLPIQGPDGNITGYVTSNQTSFENTRKFLYFDSLYLSGYANCNTSNAFPNQKFSGSGEAEFQFLVFTGNTPFLDAEKIPLKVTGVRLSNTASSFNTSTVQAPSVNEFTVLVE
jgi:hypothetical protein